MKENGDGGTVQRTAHTLIAYNHSTAKKKLSFFFCCCFSIRKFYLAQHIRQSVWCETNKGKEKKKKKKLRQNFDYIFWTIKYLVHLRNSHIHVRHGTHSLSHSHTHTNNSANCYCYCLCQCLCERQQIPHFMSCYFRFFFILRSVFHFMCINC